MIIIIIIIIINIQKKMSRGRGAVLRSLPEHVRALTKRVQDTLWSGRGDAVNFIRDQYKETLTVLEKLT
jgi:hypothetical protein